MFVTVYRDKHKATRKGNVKMETCVYKIVNTANNKVYIGSTKDFNTRKRNHLSQLKNNKHGNWKLQNAWNKYGEDNFKFKIIEKCELDERIEREQHYMDMYKSYNDENGYNIDPNAISSIGIKRSKETREKISKAQKGKKLPDETKKKISQSLKGRKKKPFTKEHLKNLSESHKGYKHSEEAKKKMSILAKIRTNTPENKKRVSLQSRGEKNNFAKLTEKEVREIKKMLKDGNHTQKQIGELFNVATTTINAINTGATWKHVV